MGMGYVYSGLIQFGPHSNESPSKHLLTLLHCTQPLGHQIIVRPVPDLLRIVNAHDTLIPTYERALYQPEGGGVVMSWLLWESQECLVKGLHGVRRCAGTSSSFSQQTTPQRTIL